MTAVGTRPATQSPAGLRQYDVNVSPLVITTIVDLRRELERQRQRDRVVGFVPTMGYLHAGHTSLMDAARRDCDTVVASIFVNPLQFAAGEDLSDYPRDLDSDAALAGEHGVELLFVPPVDEMYPDPPVLTQVAVPSLASCWEGASRPTHFTGVVRRVFQ